MHLTPVLLLRLMRRHKFEYDSVFDLIRFIGGLHESFVRINSIRNVLSDH